MLERAKKIINEFVFDEDKIALAVSGGIDSMVLAHLVLHEMALPKQRVVVVNVNHKIRKNSSDSDSAFVQRFCEQNGVSFVGECVDVPSLAAATARNIEQVAREVRLGIFSHLANTAAVKYVLTAHHAQDFTETLMLNLFRGSGLWGMRGMQILSHEFLLRPLLTTAKSEILRYAADNKIEYVQDETNQDISYNRNFLRNEILPKINERWSGFDERAAQFAQEAAQALLIVDRCVDEKAIAKVDEGVKIDLAAFSGEDIVVSRTIFSALKRLGVRSDIERKHIDIVKNLTKNQSGAEVNLTGGVYAVKLYDSILLTLQPPPAKKSDTATRFSLGLTKLGGNKIKTDITQRSIHNLKEGELICDLQKIPTDAVWRFRQEGDVFAPYGSGTKKLKDYFIDKKIERRLRDKIPVLASGSTVLAVLGVEISNLLRVEENCSTKILIEKL